MNFKNFIICIVILLVVKVLLIIRKIRQERRNKGFYEKLKTEVVSLPQSPYDRMPRLMYGPRPIILKQQSLDDVYDNQKFLEIKCSVIFDDSAVRHIYIKNTCIKDLYDMHAEDMNNHEKQNENGCMILGRWVLNTDKKYYDVSLEEVVMPGDDAVFKENEFSFGGKIKLKVAEKLRKLRRETNLQYDLTCWIHSRPGLGVSFSNADSEAQMLLKHPIHPKFLTAIIIDTLTSGLQLGIYTFKRDMTINSESDMKKMYSLKEMYKWALASIENESNH